MMVKLAEVVEGIDLSGIHEGDVVDLSERDARLLIAAGWAERVEEKRVGSDVETRQAIASGSGLPRQRIWATAKTTSHPSSPNHVSQPRQCLLANRIDE